MGWLKSWAFKRGIKSKAGAIKCYNEIKITSLQHESCNIPIFSISLNKNVRWLGPTKKFTCVLCDINVPMVPGGDESPLHVVCLVCSGADMLKYLLTVVPYGRPSLLSRNTTFQELSLVTSESQGQISVDDINNKFIILF